MTANDMFGKCSLPEFTGAAVCDSIGITIPSLDGELKKQMKIPTHIKAVGLIGSRTGAGAQIKAVDDALKTSSAEIISIEIPRDTKGWGGHGNFIVFGGETPSDVRQCVKTALDNINTYAGEIYISEAGHMELQYSARAYTAINKAFGIPVGEPFGFVCASPAPIGLAAADAAVKAAGVEIVKTLRPSEGTSRSNEVIIIFTGEASAVKAAVAAGRHTALLLLRALGSEPLSVTEPYI